MKKRILALALAGTTAFSVFGAAISANAWSWPSTDTVYDVDAYQTYTPVAKKIAVTKGAASDLTEYTVNGNIVYVNPNAKENDTYTDANGNKHPVYKTVEDYVIATYGAKQEVYTIAPTSANDALANLGNCKEIDLIRVYKDGKNYIRWAEAANRSTWTDYTIVELDGPYYVSNKAYDTIVKDSTGNGVLGAATKIYYDAKKVGNENEAFEQVDSIGDEPTADKYVPYSVNSTTDSVKLTVEDGKIVGATKMDGSSIDTNKALNVLSVDTETLKDGYVYDGTSYTNANKLIEALDADAVASIQYEKEGTVTKYADLEISSTYNTIFVEDDQKWNSPHSEWYFNGDMTGDATVEPYKVSTTMGKDGVPDVTKTLNPTVYAYDFLGYQATVGNAGGVANAWNNGTTTDAAAALLPYGVSGQDKNALIAESGRGNTNWGIRYSVVSEWIDFLDELAINKDNSYYNDRYFVGYYNESWDEFCENYTDMFYSDAYYDPWTGQQVGSVNVDLYNIKGLLKDIWKYSGEKTATYDNSPIVEGWTNANTSELVYLMQQYDKYIGNYVDKTEVASDDWGDLLLSILDAANEADFRNANEYRLYANRVESLRTAYETATTVGMIKNAEEEMYDLLVSANKEYRAASTAPSKTDLSSTVAGLYFNVGSAPDTYSVAPSTLSSNVQFKDYNYLVAAVEGKSGVAFNNLYFGSKLSEGYYSLYPMADYIDDDTTTPNEVYAGNKSAVDYTGTPKDKNYATEEYEWFWNVYQLAARMNASGKGYDGNTKQGSVDAVNDALADAVAELTVTTTPAAMDTGAMNDAVEKYAGKIDTDYNEGYYAKYVQANDYADVAEGLWQTRIAAMINGVAGEALTYQGTQVTISKNDMKTVETAIKNGETALKAIKEDPDYNAAQVTALNKAIATAEDLVSLYEGTYSTKRDDQSVNKVYTRLTGDKDQMVKSDLTAAIEAIDAAINYSEIVMGWSQNDAGKWMYGTEEGYLSNGWNKIGKTWFYFNADGTAKQSEWFQENGTWYWFNSNCGAATGWAKVDGEWYFFKGNNAMKTGWEKVDGNWYYMASSGKMVTGWCEVNGKWYYFSKASNSLGQMLYSTTVDGYKLGADGAWIK